MSDVAPHIHGLPGNTSIRKGPSGMWVFVIIFLFVIVFLALLYFIFKDQVNTTSNSFRTIFTPGDAVIGEKCVIDTDCADDGSIICSSGTCRAKGGTQCAQDSDCIPEAPICSGDNPKVCRTDKKDGELGGIPINGKCNGELVVDSLGLCKVKLGGDCNVESDCTTRFCGSGAEGTMVCAYVIAGEECIIQSGIDPCDPKYTCTEDPETMFFHCMNEFGFGKEGAVCTISNNDLPCDSPLKCGQDSGDKSDIGVCTKGDLGEKENCSIDADCTSSMLCMNGVCAFPSDTHSCKFSDPTDKDACPTGFICIEGDTCVSNTGGLCTEASNCSGSCDTTVFTISKYDNDIWNRIVSIENISSKPERLYVSEGIIPNSIDDTGGTMNIIYLLTSDEGKLLYNAYVTGSTPTSANWKEVADWPDSSTFVTTNRRSLSIVNGKYLFGIYEKSNTTDPSTFEPRFLCGNVFDADKMTPTICTDRVIKINPSDYLVESPVSMELLSSDIMIIANVEDLNTVMDPKNIISSDSSNGQMIVDDLLKTIYRKKVRKYKNSSIGDNNMKFPIERKQIKRKEKKSRDVEDDSSCVVSFVCITLLIKFTDSENKSTNQIFYEIFSTDDENSSEILTQTPFTTETNRSSDLYNMTDIRLATSDTPEAGKKGFFNMVLTSSSTNRSGADFHNVFYVTVEDKGTEPPTIHHKSIKNNVPTSFVEKVHSLEVNGDISRQPLDIMMISDLSSSDDPRFTSIRFNSDKPISTTQTLLPGFVSNTSIVSVSGENNDIYIGNFGVCV